MSFHETQSAWAQTTLQSTCKELKSRLAQGGCDDDGQVDYAQDGCDDGQGGCDDGQVD